jgi:23S rRNA (cytosine1962-C5)-methyltransferase
MKIVKDFKDYEILDMANGEKVERWGNYTLRRPDPQIIWNEKQNEKIWDKVDASYHRSNKGGGYWEFNSKLPDKWQIKYKDLTFNIKTMGFKHTGLFPEQATNWEYMINKIKNSNRKINILNLFAYTGGATVACAYAGASVCHVDSSKGMILWAKENLEASNLEDKPVRFIVDDVIKFVEREIRRGNKYDAIIMDPPSFGRGTNGEVWHFEDSLYNLIKLCMKVLSDKPLFFLINSYTTGISPTVLENILNLTINKQYEGIVESGEIGLPMTNSDLVLPCGIYGRWEDNES